MFIISESTFQDFSLLLGKEVVIDNSNIGRANECNFELPVFAYPSDTSDLYRNDFRSSLLALSNRYSGPGIFLEKIVDCQWTELAQLNDGTYGTYFPFTEKPYWIGYKVEWYKVYNLHGEGCYRIRQEYTNIVDAQIEVRYSYRFNLKLWNANLADKTTKLTYTVEGGKIANPINKSELIDFGAIIWEQEARLPKSFFGFESSEFTQEYVAYKNGAQTWIENEQVETLLYNAKKIPYPLHNEIKISALQADALYISDYNKGNAARYNRLRVIPASNYEPNWNLHNSYASVELEFQPYIQNLKRKRC